MARSFTAGSSRSLTQTATPLVNANSAGAVTGWFKTSDAGTTSMGIYGESGVSDANILFTIRLNSSVAGRISVFRRSSTPVTMEMTWDGGVNDGAWHHFCYRWSALNSHELIVDGTSRATSTTNITGTLTVNAKCIGRRENPTGTAVNYFTGDIADIATWTVDIGSAGATSLSNKSKHPMNLRGTWADLNSYWPLCQGAVLNDDDVRDYRDLTRAALTINNGTTAVDGPDGIGPTGMVAATDISKAWIWMGLASTSWITRGAGAGDQDRLLREPGNIVHHASDTGKEYKVYYSGSDDPYGGGDVAILMAYASTLGGSWTKQGAVILNATLPGEDPWVYIDPATGTYHCWFENKTGGTNANGIAHFTSSDGITWASENNTAIDNGGIGTWDFNDVSSPIVWKEATNDWRMLYEGRSPTQNGEIGYATAASPNGPWTKSGSNPVITRGAGGTWEDDFVVPDHLVKIGSTYWLIYHGNDGSAIRLGLASSTDLTSWTKVAYNPITTDRWGGHHIQGSADDFDLFYVINTVAAPDLWRLQAYGDAAAQTTEWPEPLAASGQAVARRFNAIPHIGGRKRFAQTGAW